jgi:hypothetical protein
LNKILSEEEKKFNTNNEMKTMACFIFDRSVDMITPLCSNHTYEALINDDFDINFNSIKVSPKILEKDSDKEFIKIDLSRKDQTYSMIKNYNFSKIGKFLNERLKEQNSILSEGKQKKDNILDLKKDVDKLEKIPKEYESTQNHINLTYYISKKQKLPIYKYYLNYEQSLLVGDIPNKFNEFIEDEIGKKADKYNILRLICLESIINGGISYEIYESIKKDFLNVYGYDEIFLWNNLEKMNILKVYDSNYFYTLINTELKLIYDEVNIIEPDDSSYSYSGYCPILIRLIEQAFNEGWKKNIDIINKIPGENDYPDDESEVIEDKKEIKYFLVVFIGGITYGELASIRYLNSVNKYKKIIVLTTSMINSKNIFDSLSFKNLDKKNYPQIQITG